MIPPLYSHQKKIIKEDKHKCGLFLGTGASKTRTALHLAEGPTLVICPKQQRDDKTWERENEKWDTKVNLTVVSKEDLRKDWDSYPRYETVIIDECFSKGTKIITEHGSKNIEDIKEGDVVANAIGFGKVEEVFINTVDKIYKIKLSDGKTISTTGNHPFFTNRGWVKAMDLENSHLLMSYNMIQSEYEKERTTKTFLRYLRESDTAWLASRWSLRTIQKDLFNRVCKKTQIEMFPSYMVKNYGETKIIDSEELFRKNEEKESNAHAWDKGKSYEDSTKERIQAYFSSERKWPRNAITTKNIISGIRGWLDSGISSPYKKIKKFRIPNLLQNRYSESIKKNIYRSGWGFSQQSDNKNKRFKERKVTEFIRVENVEIQEQGGSTVYNLSVSGHPSYFAEGLLVHNCHNNLGVLPAFVQKKRVSIPKTSQIFEATKNFISKTDPKRLYLLSATPVPKPMSMWGIGILFGTNWDFESFRRVYYNEVRMGGVRRIWMPKKTEDIKQRLANLVQKWGYTGAISDFTDVPEQIDRLVKIELTGEQKRALDQLAFDEADALVRASRARTIENGVIYGKKIEGLNGKVEKMTNHTTILKSNKIDYILERAMEFPKLILFVNYTAQIEELARVLRKEGYKVSTLTGKTKDRGFLRLIDESPEPHIVIAQSSISAGWELPSFPCCIFVSLSWRVVDHVQARGRILRMNKLKKNLYIYLVVRDGKDEACYNSIMEGNDFIEKMNSN